MIFKARKTNRSQNNLFLGNFLYFLYLRESKQSYKTMVELYEKQIKETDDLIDIAELLTEDSKFKKGVLKYISNPYDSDIERVGKGVFTVAVAKAEAPNSDKYDAAEAITIANCAAMARLACTGARYLTTKNTDDRRLTSLGLIKDKKYITPMAFDSKGNTLYLFGKAPDENDYQINDNQLEMLVKAIEKGYVTSAHYISTNGLFLSLVESAAPNQLGFDITSDAEMEDKDFLFSKSRYFAIVAVDEEQENDFVDYMFNNDINVTLLGHVTKGELRMDELIFGHITDYIPE